MALTVAFDVSGKEHQHPFMVIGGLVSSVTEWSEFSKAWVNRLHDAGLADFHATDKYQYFKAECNKQKQRARLQQLLGDLMGILKPRVFRKVGFVLEFNNINRIPNEKREEYRLQSYSYLARYAAERVREWLSSERWDTPIEYVFESGDEGAGHLISRFVEDGYGQPCFRPKRDVFGPDGRLVQAAFVPLQAADWLAHNTFITYRAALENDVSKVETWTSTEFDRIPGELAVISDEAIDHLAQFIRVAEATDHLGQC